jgi:homoserine O-acetyltransferase/O-succinyltransferase
MKRLVVPAFASLAWLASLAACRNTHDDPRPSPPPPAAPTAPAQARPAPPSTPARPAPQPIAGVMPVSGDFAIKDFAFTSGDKLPELRIHYMTLGTPKRDAAGRVNNAVLIMHGTTGSGQQFSRKQFADVLFGPGQPLDLTRYYVILPDDIGHGGSSKPSDGMHAKFPQYGYTDMVEAEHALVVDGLKVERLRLVMGTSMGCMHAWMWAEKWPSMMDAVMPLACLPTQIAGRNRQWRKMAIDAIRQDPEWNNGEYTRQPRAALMNIGHLLVLAGSAPLADQKRMATRDDADKEVEATEARYATMLDANDALYAIAASRDYDPSADLEKITAPVLFVNSADDFVNPPELSIAERLIKRVKRGRFLLIPASESTHGHGTHTWGVFWHKELQALLDATAPR